MSRAPIAWRAWLPESALERSGLDQSLADVARQWSLKWLARKTVRPLSTLTASGLPTDSALRWLALEEDVVLAMTAAGVNLLAMLMLGETVPPAAVPDADRQLLDGFVETAVRDLCRRIAEILGLSPETRWRELGEGEGPAINRPRTLQLGADGANPLVHIAFATDVLIALAKRRLPPAPMRERVKALGPGLAGQAVDVSASLGRCSLTIADLAGLAVGDVLVLDHAANEPLALTVNGKRALRGKCAVRQVADSLELNLLEPLAS